MEANRPMTLEEFAASGQGMKVTGFSCWACGIPQRAEVDTALRKGMSVGVIRRWLIDECGYPESAVTRAKIQNHRDKGHHERDI